MTKLNWNIIKGHAWSTSMYTNALIYLTTGKLPSGSPKALRNFKNRIQYYTEINGEIVISDHNPPYYTNHTMYTGIYPVIYKVVNPLKKNEVLDKFMENMELSAYNSKSLYDKVIKSNLLGISRDYIEEYLKQNLLLKQRKNKSHKPVVESFRPNFPFEYWQMDYIDFNKNMEQIHKNKHYKHILVIIDIFSKFIYLYPVKSDNSTFLYQILQKLFLSGDIPLKLGSDNGSAFKSKEINDLCKRFNIHQIFGKPYSPQTQGFVENKNKQIKNMLYVHFTKYNNSVWYDILDCVAFSINNTKHTVTNLCPMEVHRGRNISLNNEIVYSNENSDVNNENYNVKEYNNTQNVVYEQRIKYVTEKIYNNAEKNENRQRDKQLFYNGDYVKIATFHELDSKIQPLQIKLIDTNNTTEINIANPLRYKKIGSDVYTIVSDIATRPRSQFYKLDLNTKKWNYKVNRNFEHNIFQIISVRKEHNEKYIYQLFYRHKDNTEKKYRVQRMINYSENSWSPNFYSEHLLKVDIKDLKVQYKYPVRPEYNFVDLLQLQEKTRQPSKTYKTTTNEVVSRIPTRDEIKKLFSKTDEIITKALNLPNKNRIDKLSQIKSENKVIIFYNFIIRNEFNNISFTLDQGYILSYDSNRKTKEQPDDPFRIRFIRTRETQVYWNLNLLPEKYFVDKNNINIDGGWCFDKVPDFTNYIS